jgi:acid phosphatase (class A)
MVASSKTHFLDLAVIQSLALKLPAPPEPDSLAAQADLEAVLQVQAWRTPEQAAFAKKIDEGSVFDFAEVLGDWFTADNLPGLRLFFKQAGDDAGAASGLAKNHFERLRPPYVDARVRPCVGVPPRNSFSYPSGHSIVLHLDALILTEIFPERRDALLEWGRKAAWGRIIGGVHFPSDDLGGRLLAESLFAALRKNPAFLAGIERCREEAVPFLLKKAG